MEQKHQIPSSPLPNQSSLLRDISNFKTPKPKPNPNSSSNFESPCPQFFSALKQTPRSSYSTVHRRPRYSLAAQKLKAVELEQSKSARKTQTDKEKALKSLAKSLTVWLNFLFENPRSCGVEVSRFTGEDSSDESSSMVFLGEKRDIISHGGVEVDREWRGPKRRKDTLWIHKGEVENKFSSSKYSRLQVSLADVCSLDDMKERMTVYLSLTTCNEIFEVMTHITKSIDDGRLKMKAHCPIVTDVGMKENALKILMSYNPVWLRIGLYIIFGGESLLPNPNADMNSEKEASFLKMAAEKLFFSHSGLAKAYIYNKLVDGLYRPGYYEKLGSVILKKFLLLALILDRAKSQSSLPISYGIDGIDGGSPLLFTSRATFRSSSEVISDFLSPDVMHGVGNLLTHLTIIGYKVSYQQNPLVKYVFKVTDLFNDLQDGILLFRVIQLLTHDPSILKKVVVPSDDRKKNMVNCEISVKYLKKIGVPLCDEDGTEITAEDIVNGDKELIISLLWNIFAHLQLPLLINNKLVSDEIAKIRGPEVELLSNNISHLEMLLEWIKAICDNYDLKVEKFDSLVDGKAMWCLLDYYFQKERCDASSNLDLKDNKEGSIMSASDYVDAVHNFLLSQKLTTLLGNFPEVLQVSDILEYKGACSDRGVIILLVFLSSQLILKRNLQQINFHKLLGHNQNSERKCIKLERQHGNQKHVEEMSQNRYQDNGRNFKAIMSWWKEMAQNNSKANVIPEYSTSHSSTRKQSSDNQRVNSAIIIQSSYRRFIEHRHYTRIKKAVSFLQVVIRVWLSVKNKSAITKFKTFKIQEPSRFSRYLVDRHDFIKIKRSVIIIQDAVRYWIAKNRQTEAAIIIQQSAATVIQACYRSWIIRKHYSSQKQAASQIQSHYRGLLIRKGYLNQKLAVIKVQSYYRGLLVRKGFLNQKQAAIKVQNYYRGLLIRKSFLNQKQAAIKVQSYYRGLLVRKGFLHHKQAAIKVQNYYRGLLIRKSFLNQKQAAIKVQSYYRGLLVRKGFLNQKQAAIKVQSYYHGLLTRKSFLNQKQAATRIQSCYRRWVSRCSFLKKKQTVMKLQSSYRSVKCLRNFRQYKFEIHSAVTIQSHTRGWIARKATQRRRYAIVKIQRFCKGWLMRRRFLLQKEAAIRIQSAFRCFKCFKAFHGYTNAANTIQRFAKGWIVRKRLLGSCPEKEARSSCNHDSLKDCKNGHELKMYTHSVLKLQRWWRCILLVRSQTRTRSAILIQSNVRRWIAKKITAQKRHRIVVIQSYWKGYIVRKHSKENLSAIRLRVQKASTNVVDGMRLINRLIAALSELKNMKSVSGILHTCATIDMATKLSQKCCEQLVAAGAINTLLELIRSISRSIADQEVLRHSLSTFRNLTRYPHLTEALINTRGSGQIILWEYIRNKDDVHFIAADVLRNICSNKKGVESLRGLHALVKRLNNLVEDLKKKAANKRNPQTILAKEQTDRRLKEAIQILKLITND